VFDKIIERVQSIKTGSGPVLGLAIKLIKTHLPHHVPSVKTLERLDQFCINMGAEHLPSTNLGKVRSEPIVGKLVYLRALFSLYTLLGRLLGTRLELPGETSVPLGRERLFLPSLPHLKLVLYPCRWIWSPAMELMTVTISSPISLRTSQAKQSRFKKPVCILRNLCYVVWQRPSVDVDTLEADAIFCDGLSRTFPSSFFSD